MWTIAAPTSLGVDARFDGDAAVGLRRALLHRLGHFGLGVADVDLAAGDVEGAAVERDRFGQARDRVLGRGVGRAHRPRRMGRDRAVVDDASALRPLPLHQRIGALRAEERAVEVDVDDRLPLLVGQLFEGDRRRADAGVVEQQVEPTEGALHRRVKRRRPTPDRRRRKRARARAGRAARSRARPRRAAPRCARRRRHASRPRRAPAPQRGRCRDRRR